VRFTDYQGSVRVVVRASTNFAENVFNPENIVEVNNFDPWGVEFGRAQDPFGMQPIKHQDMERLNFGNMNVHNHGARWAFNAVGRWLGMDPLMELFYSMSPYTFLGNNPVRFIDPDGRRIVGVTGADALRFQEDLHTIFAGDEFEQFRGLLTLDRRGTTFNTISSDALSSAFEGVSLSTDQMVLVNEVVGAINSRDIHMVEYVDVGGNVSRMGSEAIRTRFNDVVPGAGDGMMLPNGRMSAETASEIFGGGGNVPTRRGSHSVIIEGEGVVHPHGRALTAGHEVFGHGPASARRVSDVDNQIRAVRVDNLMRRVMGLPPYPNTRHGGVYIPFPTRLP